MRKVRMLKLVVAVVFLAVILAPLGVMAKAKSAPSTPAPPPNTITRNLEVPMGKDFSVDLDSNPTTGYHWEFTKPLMDIKIIKPGSIRFQQANNPKPGTGGKEIWSFKAIGKGATVIHMRYVRAGDKNASAAKHAKIMIKVI